MNYLKFRFILIFIFSLAKDLTFIIETTRLKIRPFNNQDSHFLYTLLSDPEVMAHSRDGALDIEGTKKYLIERIIKLNEQSLFLDISSLLLFLFRFLLFNDSSLLLTWHFDLLG